MKKEIARSEKQSTTKSENSEAAAAKKISAKINQRATSGVMA